MTKLPFMVVVFNIFDTVSIFWYILYYVITQPQGPINSPTYLAQGPHIYQGPQIHMPIYPNPIPLGYISIYIEPYIRVEIVMQPCLWAKMRI